MMEHIRITVASPPDREYLVAEVFLNDIQWAEVSQESGSLEVEFYQRPDGKPWRIPFTAAVDALLRAKIELEQ